MSVLSPAKLGAGPEECPGPARFRACPLRRTVTGMVQIVKQQRGDAPDPGEMPSSIDVAGLIREVERYLAAVAVFRGMDCEPTWRSECLGA